MYISPLFVTKSPSFMNKSFLQLLPPTFFKNYLLGRSPQPIEEPAPKLIPLLLVTICLQLLRSAANV